MNVLRTVLPALFVTTGEHGVTNDGEEFGVAQLVQRQNVAGGISTVYTNESRCRRSPWRSQPMDTLIVWDPHVLHGVSPTRPVDPDEQAIRDTLLIGYDPRTTRASCESIAR